MFLSSLNDTLLVFALPEEEQGLFHSYHKIYTGIGKVNATYHLVQALVAWKEKRGCYPQLVLNIGSAGSSHFSRGTIVNCTRFIQRDMDVTALGYAPYATPFEDHPVILTSAVECEGYPKGTCGSADSFVTDGAAHDWNVVDMEAYALAKVCLLQKIPFCCLKYITDGADEQAHQTWAAALSSAAEALHKGVGALVQA